MRCEEFRNALDTDPGGDFPGRSEHMAGCGDCARYAADALVFEQRLAAALTVEVPDFDFEIPGESTGDDGDNVVALDERRRSGILQRGALPAFAGIAAALVLAIGFVLQFAGGSQDLAPSALAAEVLAHMEHEPYSRVVTSDAVASSTLSEALSPAVSRLDREQVGLVTYARTCPINGRPVPHLVVQGADGPVTLLLMAGEKLEAPVPLQGDGFHGVILPVGEGSIAIVGETGSGYGQQVRP